MTLLAGVGTMSAIIRLGRHLIGHGKVPVTTSHEPPPDAEGSEPKCKGIKTTVVVAGVVVLNLIGDLFHTRLDPRLGDAG